MVFVVSIVVMLGARYGEQIRKSRGQTMNNLKHCTTILEGVKFSESEQIKAMEMGGV